MLISYMGVCSLGGALVVGLVRLHHGLAALDLRAHCVVGDDGVNGGECFDLNVVDLGVGEVGDLERGSLEVTLTIRVAADTVRGRGRSC